MGKRSLRGQKTISLSHEKCPEADCSELESGLRGVLRDTVPPACPPHHSQLGVSILLVSSWSKMAAGAPSSVFQAGGRKKGTKGKHNPTQVIAGTPFKETSPKSHPTTSTHI